MTSKNKQNVTNLALSKKIDDLDNKFDTLQSTVGTLATSLEDLACMTQKGLLEVKNQNTQTQAELKEFRQENAKEHADMRFKLSETVHKTEHEALKVRVQVLEGQRA